MYLINLNDIEKPNRAEPIDRCSQSNFEVSLELEHEPDPAPIATHVDGNHVSQAEESQPTTQAGKYVTKRKTFQAIIQDKDKRKSQALKQAGKPAWRDKTFFGLKSPKKLTTKGLFSTKRLTTRFRNKLGLRKTVDGLRNANANRIPDAAQATVALNACHDKEDLRREEILKSKLGFSAKTIDNDELIAILRERTDLVGKVRYWTLKTLESVKFDSVMGFIILLNSILIGLHVQADVSRDIYFALVEGWAGNSM